MDAWGGGTCSSSDLRRMVTLDTGIAHTEGRLSEFFYKEMTSAANVPES